jgi:hypothetical protein
VVICNAAQSANSSGKEKMPLGFMDVELVHRESKVGIALAHTC